LDKKYIFITGGVVSSLGKGVTVASIASLLELSGYKINILKIDPYINVNPGTMNPMQHGEVFVTNDGAETDLDLGYYERFTNLQMCKDNNFTSGQIYQSVIEKERNGFFLGETIQVIPHITNEIKNKIIQGSKDCEVTIVEIGGTVGDIESLPFLEAIRQLYITLNRDNCIFIHLTLVPYISITGEVKTKPTQHSVKELRSIGIQPHILICRSYTPLLQDEKNKIALFANLENNAIFTARDVDIIYKMPREFHDQGLTSYISKLLKIPIQSTDLKIWDNFIDKIAKINYAIDIAVIGKYIKITDAYKSLHDALSYAGIKDNIKVNIHYIDSNELNEKNVNQILYNYDGIVIPGGFGLSGIKGKIIAIKYARENNIPFLGICLGLQLAIIEFMQNKVGYKEANSTEIDPYTIHPVVYLIDDNKSYNEKHYLHKMRLGSQGCNLIKDSLIYQIYSEKIIFERHRHCYEVNNAYIPILEKYGMKISAYSVDSNLVEVIEIPNHRWFLACQFHPEFTAKPLHSHKLFSHYIKNIFNHKTTGTTK
jgi:CTP synthase